MSSEDGVMAISNSKEPTSTFSDMDRDGHRSHPEVLCTYRSGYYFSFKFNE